MQRKTLFILFAALLSLLTATPTFAQDQTASLDFADYMLPLEDYTLDNGLRVVVARDDSAPVVAVNLTYHVGGANDPEGRSGFAHLFEHMMFYGSAHVKQGEFDTYLTEIGAEFNAYTADDKTVYYTTAPANQLPLILWLESDRLASLTVDQEAFDTERNVVIEEFNERVANAPYGFASVRLETLPFLGYPPYARPVIGNVDELNAATLTDVQTFFDTYYVPNNLTLVIVGDIDVEQTKLLVDAYFGRIPSGEPLTPILERYPLPAQLPVVDTDDANGCALGYQETVIDPLAELPALWANVVGAPTGTDDYYALSLLANILGDGESSRFEQNIVQEGKAAFTFAQLDDSKLGATNLLFGIYPKPGDPITATYNILRSELDKVIAEGVTEAELARAQQQTVLGAITSFRGNVGDTAEWIQDYVLRYGDANGIPADIARFQAVTLADIQRVAQTYLCDRPLNLITILQEGEEVRVDDPAPLVEVAPLPPSPWASLPEGVVSRQSAPAALPATELSIPQFVTFTLENGLDVIFVEEHKTPEINVRLYVAGSDTALPAEKQGIAELLAGLITKGTKERTADEIASQIENVGGSLSGQAFAEFTGVFASGPSSEQTLIFDLLADVTLNPAFPEEEFVLLRDQTLAGMEFDTTDPDTLASRQFNRIAYANHPYSFYATPDTVNTLTTEDLAAFHEAYYKPNNALLVIVGDLALEQAQAETERVFAAWRRSRVEDPFAYPDFASGDATQIYLIDRPDAEQSTLRLGNLAIRARHPDRYALNLANTVLGGSGLASRLNRNLREDKGYTYGVYSGVTQRNDLGAFLVAGDVGVANTGDAVTEILRELRQIRRTGVTTDELVNAQGMMIGQFTMSIADPASLAGQLATRHLYGIPLTEIESYATSVANITASEVLTAARAHIGGREPIIVVVGDAEMVKPQLQGLGKVAVVDAAGNVVEIAEALVKPEETEQEPAAEECTCPAVPSGEAEEAKP